MPNNANGNNFATDKCFSIRLLSTRRKKFEPAKNRGLRAHDWLTIEFLYSKALTLMKYDPNDRKQLLRKTHEKLNALLKTIRQ